MRTLTEPPFRYADRDLLERAIDALTQTVGINARIVAMAPLLDNGAEADALIEIGPADTAYQYVVEIKRVDRFATIGQIKNKLDKFKQSGLLVAPRITADTADKCRQLGVQFIDGNGNAFLQAPGMYVWVKGQRPRENDLVGMTAGAPRGGNPTALRIMFALLCQPDCLNAPYREITRIAGVALGAVGKVFEDLNTRGYLTGGPKNGERLLLERQRLIDEWVTNYPIKLRPKLNAKRFHAPDDNWWRHTDITTYGAQWGGEIAADKLTHYLKPAAATIYMRPEGARQNLARLVTDKKLRGAADGNIEVLETFWDFPTDPDLPDTVPPLLVYADLLATLDPRNLEVARLIHEQNLNGPHVTP